ncbi:MAG: 50S ribosomal protein L28 [Armatimonadota bacterium]|nr:50S ribosomal protein L28 [Armatimonadota bacterium]
MARRCAICGKGPAAGKSLSHSHVRAPRRFLPNLQRVRIMLDGTRRRVNICTSCLTSRKIARAS